MCLVGGKNELHFSVSHQYYTVNDSFSSLADEDRRKMRDQHRRTKPNTSSLHPNSSFKRDKQGMAKQNGRSQNSRRSSKRKSRQQEVNSSEEEKNDKSILEKIPLCEVITIKDDESDDEVLCDLKTENSKSKHINKRVKRQKDKKERVPVPGEPDGFGGLDQGATFVVEYAKTSRAACKRCDIRIKKGELRIGHRPLFRGKPGYQIFKHLE